MKPRPAAKDILAAAAADGCHRKTWIDTLSPADQGWLGGVFAAYAASRTQPPLASLRRVVTEHLGCQPSDSTFRAAYRLWLKTHGSTARK